MSEIPNDVLAYFEQGKQDYADATANTGEGFQGEWPPAGEQDLWVQDVTVSSSTFRLGRTDTKVPCAVVQFKYQWIPREDNPDYDPEKVLIFDGKEFQLVLGQQNLSRLPDPDGKNSAYKAAQANLSRFKGHCAKILGKNQQDCNDPGADIQAVAGRIGDGTKLFVTSRIEYYYPNNDKSNNPYKTEYIKDLITG